MQGIILRGIQDMVLSKYGEKVWEKIRSIANCQDEYFAVSLNYADQLIFDLLHALSEECNLSFETAQIELGKFMVPHTLKTHYASYFKRAGSSPKEFLLHIDEYHEEATRRNSKSSRPKFDIEEKCSDKLLLHYYSRRGLCSLLQGLILGVGLAFDRTLTVREIACVKKGYPHCIMEITFL
jgi:predicted hydrocarbon binding protein